MTPSLRIGLAAGALFLGGFLGGLVGTWMLPRAVPMGETGAGVSAADHAEFLRVLRELLDESQRSHHEETHVSVPGTVSDRLPVATDETAAIVSLDGQYLVPVLERLTQALERLAQALATSLSRGATGAGAPGAFELPPEGSRQGAVASLLERDVEDLTREFLLWTPHQVVERLGRPDEINGYGHWIYRGRMPGAASDQEIMFVFQDGTVRAVQAVHQRR